MTPRSSSLTRSTGTGIARRPRPMDLLGRCRSRRNSPGSSPEHRRRSTFVGHDHFVFATRSGRPFGQRNIGRALRAAQFKAVDRDGQPTFPILHAANDRGRPVLVPHGALPSMHSFRHTVASRALVAGESVDEIAFLLGHRDANVTRAVTYGSWPTRGDGPCAAHGCSPSTRTSSARPRTTTTAETASRIETDEVEPIGGDSGGLTQKAAKRSEPTTLGSRDRSSRCGKPLATSVFRRRRSTTGPAQRQARR